MTDRLSNDFADQLAIAVQRIRDQDERIAELEARCDVPEPELTCPGIDEAIVAIGGAAAPELRDALERVRFENSNMRYSLWHEKAFRKEAEARIAELEAEVERLKGVAAELHVCNVKIADGAEVLAKRILSLEGLIVVLEDVEASQQSIVRELDAKLAEQDAELSRLRAAEHNGERD